MPPKVAKKDQKRGDEEPQVDIKKKPLAAEPKVKSEAEHHHKGKKEQKKGSKGKGKPHH